MGVPGTMLSMGVGVGVKGDVSVCWRGSVALKPVRGLDARPLSRHRAGRKLVQTLGAHSEP